MDETIKIFTEKLILTVNDEYHEVHLFHEGKKLKKGFGYIKGSYVYVYRGKLEKFDKKNLAPGIYLTKNGEYVFVEPDKKEKELYHINNVVELNLDKIFEDIQEHGEDFVDPEVAEVINNSGEIYTPEIRENDDFLKYLVKMAILKKKINLKNYRGKFTNPYALNNMKSGLDKDTKMTVTNFKIWCEILGLKWKMILEDDGTDKHSPLPEPIEIESEDF